MELNEKDRGRFVAEEKPRMETRKEYPGENLGGPRGMCLRAFFRGRRCASCSCGAGGSGPVRSSKV